MHQTPGDVKYIDHFTPHAMWLGTSERHATWKSLGIINSSACGLRQAVPYMGVGVFGLGLGFKAQG